MTNASISFPPTAPLVRTLCVHRALFGVRMSDGDRDVRRRARIDALELSAAAWQYTMAAFDWLRAHESLPCSSDPVLAEAIEVAGYDAAFITVKLHRAASRLATLQQIAQQEFPRAMDFVRPGFDEPWR